ncbi:MAG: hypothetical protein C0517_01570 [Erythrobacter sp.]|nr:hypothetical protein [Erythrobacter sp.]
MRPNSVLISAVTAPIAAILIAAVFSIVDGWNWENPLGLVHYAVLFVFPFTLVGSFVVVLPAHKFAARVFDNHAMQATFVLIASGIVGALILQLISEQVLAAGLIGTASGLATAIVWLVLHSKTTRLSTDA